jgi:hypothetical protein
MIFCDKSFKFLYETYIVLAMCSCLNMLILRWDSIGNFINSSCTLVTIFLVLVFPFTVAIFYSRPTVFKSVYNREQGFMDKYGSIITSLNFHRHGPKVFTYLWVSMLRKFWLVLTLVFMQESVIWSFYIITM